MPPSAPTVGRLLRFGTCCRLSVHCNEAAQRRTRCQRRWIGRLMLPTRNLPGPPRMGAACPLQLENASDCALAGRASRRSSHVRCWNASRSGARAIPSELPPESNRHRCHFKGWERPATDPNLVGIAGATTIFPWVDIYETAITDSKREPLEFCCPTIDIQNACPPERSSLTTVESTRGTCRPDCARCDKQCPSSCSEVERRRASA